MTEPASEPLASWRRAVAGDFDTLLASDPPPFADPERPTPAELARLRERCGDGATVIAELAAARRRAAGRIEGVERWVVDRVGALFLLRALLRRLYCQGRLCQSCLLRITPTGSFPIAVSLPPMVK